MKFLKVTSHDGRSLYLNPNKIDSIIATTEKVAYSGPQTLIEMNDGSRVMTMDKADEIVERLEDL